MNCPNCFSDINENIKYPNSEVYICKKCKLNFIDAQQGKEFYMEFHKEYEHYNPNEDEKRTRQYSIHAEFIQKTIPSGIILDVGCSSGRLLSLLLKNDRLRLFGIDPDTSAIHHAKKEYENKIDFQDTDLINMNTSTKFDGIIFRGTFQYLGFDLKNTMEKIANIINPHGKIIILSLPNSDSLLYHILGEEWDLYRKLEHVLIFNRQSIMNLAKIYGYTITHMSYPYLETPYANVELDYKNLIELIKNDKRKSFPFWGNLMQIVLQKL